MTMDFQTWMRIVWQSVIEPAQMAAKVLTLRFSNEALWTGLALVVVLNALFLGGLQLVAAEATAQMIAMTPFAYLAVAGSFLTLLVFMLVHSGRMMGGAGTIEGSLSLLVWFQAVALTLQAIQIVLVLFSPTIAALFGLISTAAIVWVFVNLVNVLHGFAHLGKAVLVVFIAMIATALGTLIVISMFGISPPGGTV